MESPRIPRTFPSTVGRSRHNAEISASAAVGSSEMRRPVCSSVPGRNAVQAVGVGAGNQCFVATQTRQTESMTGTSTSTPTTVASAAPDSGP